MQTRLQRASQVHRHQRGISLFVVMVMVLLTTLLVLWASRTALLNEKVTGVDSDYQRALETAQAMVRDAEMDIKGQRTDGSPCVNAGQFTGCRAWGVIDAASQKAFFPSDVSDFQDLQSALSASTPPCVAGICVPPASGSSDEFWLDDSKLSAMKAKASLYGQHTGALATAIGNPLLNDAGGKAWYWVEVLPYDLSAAIKGGAAKTFAPDADAPFLYRITAIASGLRPQTRAVVQSVFVWRRRAS